MFCSYYAASIHHYNVVGYIVISRTYVKIIVSLQQSLA